MSSYLGVKEIYFRPGAKYNPSENDGRIIYNSDDNSIRFQIYDGTQWVNVGKMKE